jgi:hypothetical protein
MRDDIAPVRMALSSAISFTLIMVLGVVLFISFLATAILGLLARRYPSHGISPSRSFLS